MKEFPGNHLPSHYARLSFATVLLYPLGVTARSNDIECAVVQCISASIIFLYSLFQPVWHSMIFHKEVAKWNLSCSVSGRLKLHAWMVHTVGTRVQNISYKVLAMTYVKVQHLYFRRKLLVSSIEWYQLWYHFQLYIINGCGSYAHAF